MYSTGNSMNNLSSYCGLVNARIRASDKELPVKEALSSEEISDFVRKLKIVQDEFEAALKLIALYVWVLEILPKVLIQAAKFPQISTFATFVIYQVCHQ
jgi:hypothetical protein